MSKATISGSTRELATVADSAPNSSRLKGDEDDDDTASAVNGGNGGSMDSDADVDEDSRENAQKDYLDGDDGAVMRFGRTPNAGERATIAALVERYFAAAAADDGAKACSLLYFIVAESLVQDFVEVPGHPYLRGLTKCPQILTSLFAHDRARFPAVKITGIRVRRNLARVFVGSSTQPAGVMEAKRERGVWKIDRLYIGPLP